MNRLTDKLSSLRESGEKALALFLTAGFPRINSTPALVLKLEKAGADIVELGMPFSDPLADGPVIQAASEGALKNGVTLKSILADVRQIRSKSDLPIVLMGYLNPILAYGAERFFADAERAGVDGVIFPELPLEESDRFNTALRTHRLANILLVTPTSSPERIEAIDAASEGFLYCVSATGVTGMKGHRAGAGYVNHVKSHARRNPVLVGFGISSTADARAMAEHADGIIVGSALLKRLASGEAPTHTMEWVRRLKQAIQMRRGRNGA